VTTHICDLSPSGGEPESARGLLYRHGLPEDIVDGALCLHAQELAAVQRRDAAVWGVDTAAGKRILAAADLIDPTRAPAAGSAPATDRAAVPGCVCSEPTTTGTVHRTDGPCYVDDRADEFEKLVRWHREDGAALAEMRATIERLRARHKASLQHADKVNNELMEEVQRYADGTERPVLWSVYNDMHKRAATAEAERDRLRRMADETPQPTEVVHACPPDGSGLTPCCGRTPFELPRTDRMTDDPDMVTCQPAPAAVAQPDEEA
jgi:hypothetical protein